MASSGVLTVLRLSARTSHAGFCCSGLLVKSSNSSILSSKYLGSSIKLLSSQACKRQKEISPADHQSQNELSKPEDIGGGSWQEIYQGLLSTQVKLIKSFSLGTSLIGLSIQPFVITHLGSSMSLVMSFSALIGMFTFVTPALIHWFTRKYVFRLSYDPKNEMYAATTLSFFLREKTIHFKSSDVTVPEIPRMFTTFLVKKKPLFVDMETFKDIEHYGRIMGYDKPIDLRVDPPKKDQ